MHLSSWEAMDHRSQASNARRCLEGSLTHSLPLSLLGTLLRLVVFQLVTGFLWRALIRPSQKLPLSLKSLAVRMLCQDLFSFLPFSCGAQNVSSLVPFLSILGPDISAAEVQHPVCHQDSRGTGQPIRTAQNVRRTEESEQELSSPSDQGRNCWYTLYIGILYL